MAIIGWLLNNFIITILWQLLVLLRVESTISRCDLGIARALYDYTHTHLINNLLVCVCVCVCLFVCVHCV